MSEIETAQPMTTDGIVFYVSADGSQVGISQRGLSRLCGYKTSSGNVFSKNQTLENMRDGVSLETAPKLLKPMWGNIFCRSLRGMDNANVISSEAAVAIIEWFAFDRKNEIAVESFRKFAKKGFEDWVKEITGFASNKNDNAVLNTLQQILSEVQELKTEVKEYRNIRQTTTTIFPGMDYCLDTFNDEKAIAPARVSVFLSEWLETKGITLNKSNMHKLANLAAETYRTMKQEDPVKVMRPDKNGKGGSLTNVFFPEDYPILEVSLKRLF